MIERDFIIVIPTLNEEDFVGDLLNDIALSSLHPRQFEIVVSDSGSSDDTAKVVQKFAQARPELKIHFSRAPKKGVSLARNHGFLFKKEAFAKYIFFIDADARIPHPDCLKNILEEMEERKLDVAGIYFSVEATDTFYRLLNATFKFLMKNLEKTSIPTVCGGAGIVVKKELHDAIQGFDERMHLGEDIDYGVRAAKKGKFGVLKNSAVVFSKRRYEKEGRLRLCLTHFTAALLFMVGVRVMPHKYKVGHFGGKAN